MLPDLSNMKTRLTGTGFGVADDVAHLLKSLLPPSPTLKPGFPPPPFPFPLFPLPPFGNELPSPLQARTETKSALDAIEIRVRAVMARGTANIEPRRESGGSPAIRVETRDPPSARLGIARTRPA